MYSSNKQSWIRRTTLPLIINLPHLVQTVGFCVDKNQIGFLSTFCPNGTLEAAVKDMLAGKPRAGFGPTQLSKCIFGIATTMARLHARRAIHRDLKLCNVFLDDQFEPVLGDFGLSKIVTDPLKMTMGIGSPICMAPELWSEDDSYGNPVDVYAFAVLMYNLFESRMNFRPGEKPPRSPQQLMMRVAKGERMVRPEKIPDSLWRLIEVCWHQDPTKRPTFAEIVDRLKTSRDHVFPGTDMNEYVKYQERLGNERLDDPRPVELVDTLYWIVGWPQNEDDAWDCN
jgi:serine/threonine protein kinase